MSSTQMATRVRAQGSPTPRLAPLVQVAICKQTIATASARRFHLPPTSAVRQEASTDVVGDHCQPPTPAQRTILA